MFQKLAKLVTSDTAKDASLMTAGTATAALFAAAFFILAARLLGPAEFGIFALTTAASFLLADTVDIALDTALIRFVAKERKADPQNADRFAKTVLLIKLILGFSLALLLHAIAAPLSDFLFHQPLPSAVSLLGLGTAFQLLYMFEIAYLQGSQEFAKAAVGITALPAVRLMGLLLLLWFSAADVTTTLAAYFFATLLCALVFQAWIPKNFLKVKLNRHTAETFARYTAPLTVGYALAAVSGRIDNLFLTTISGPAAVGYYAAASRLFTPLQFLMGAISSVFAPRFASFADHQQVKRYFRKTLLALTALSLSLLLLFPFSGMLVNFLYGSQYQPAVSVFRVLVFAFVLFALQTPLTSVLLYSFAKTKVFTAINAIQLATIIIVDSILIPRYAQDGAAIAFLITQAVVLLMLIGFSQRQFRGENQ